MACSAGNLTWTWLGSLKSVNIPQGCTELYISRPIGGDGGAALSVALTLSPQLTTLCMTSSGLSVTSTVLLAESISHSNLQYVKLAHEAVGDAGAAAFALAISESRHLTALELHDAQIRTTGAVAIADVLSNSNDGLAWLSLSGNAIGDAGGAALAAALPTAPSLRELHLLDCDLGDFAGQAFARALSSRSSATAALVLSHNGKMTARSFRALIDAVRGDNGQLQTLELGEEAEDGGFTDVLHGLLSRTAVDARRQASENAVDGSSDGADDDDHQHSDNAQSGSCTWRDLRWVSDRVVVLLPSRCVRLSLRDSDPSSLGDDGVKALAAALAREAHAAADRKAPVTLEGGPATKRRLRELDISDCNISEAGAASLAAVLPDSRIERLILASNPLIGDGGARLLARALASSPSVSIGGGMRRWGQGLVELDLHDCGIGPNGVEDLVRALGGAGGEDDFGDRKTRAAASPSPTASGASIFMSPGALDDSCPRILYPTPQSSIGVPAVPALALQVLHVSYRGLCINEN